VALVLITNWFLGGRVDVLLGADATGGACGVVLHELAPGMATPLHRQPGDDETFVVLSGELELWVDGERATIGAGQAAFVRRGL
jgi:quercetin dioxygenase-like cupin family protein